MLINTNAEDDCVLRRCTCQNSRFLQVLETVTLNLTETAWMALVQIPTPVLLSDGSWWFGSFLSNQLGYNLFSNFWERFLKFLGFLFLILSPKALGHQCFAKHLKEEREKIRGWGRWLRRISESSPFGCLKYLSALKLNTMQLMNHHLLPFLSCLMTNVLVERALKKMCYGRWRI